jgi:hypothetical protein
MDVRMPDGTIVTNVPDGMTRTELMARYNKARAPFPVKTTAEVGPVTGRLPIPGAGAAQAAAQAQEIEGQVPAFQRFEMSAQENAPLLLGGTAALTVPGAGLGALALSSGVGGLFGGAGELARQRMAGEDLDFGAAAEEGTDMAAGGMIAGGSLKLLGRLAAKLFYSPLTPAAQRASKFAAEEDVPFPLSSAMPGSGAGRTQTASGAFLPGAIRNASDAQRVAQYLNQRVGTFTEKANVFDDAVREGQAWFSNLVNPNKAGATKAWNLFETAAGDAPIQVQNTIAAVREARDAMSRAGIGEGDKFYDLLARFLTNPDKVRFANELNLFASRAQKGFKGDTYKWANSIQDAVEQDVIAHAKSLGLDEVSEQFTEGLAQRALYRELRKVPELERLAGELGGGRDATKGTFDWMNTLFTKGNGKALAKLREMNPDLYHNLADAWLAKQINGFSKMSSDTMVRSLDGKAMRAWFVQNQPKITEIFGKPQAKVLDNFTEYAELMSSSVTKANKGLGEPLALWGRVATETVATVKAPLLMIPTEGGAFLLARGLSDPSSQVFKLFTQGVSPSWRSFAVKSGQLAGQAGGSESR